MTRADSRFVTMQEHATASQLSSLAQAAGRSIPDSRFRGEPYAIRHGMLLFHFLTSWETVQMLLMTVRHSSCCMPSGALYWDQLTPRGRTRQEARRLQTRVQSEASASKSGNSCKCQRCCKVECCLMARCYCCGWTVPRNGIVWDVDPRLCC